MSIESDEALPGMGAGAETIDWQALRDRLTGVEIDDALSAAAAEKRRRILHDRAEALAKQEELEQEDGSILAVLQFALGDERYAVDATAVREICRVKTITPVPGTPGHVAGVMSVRGRIVAVLDLTALIEAPKWSDEEEAFAVVLRSGDMEFAVIADAVVGLRSVATGSLQVDVSGLVGARRAYLLGVTPDRVAVLDAQRLLSDEALVAAQQRSDAVNSGGEG